MIGKSVLRQVPEIAMARRPRDFSARSESERRRILESTWCENCAEVDLGMLDPLEFEEGGDILVEGSCARCGVRVVSTIDEKHVD